MLIYQLCFSGFSLDPVDIGTSAGDKVLIGGGGGLIRGNRHYGGLTLIDYVINYKYCYCYCCYYYFIDPTLVIKLLLL